MSLKTAFLNLFKPEAGDRFSITGTEGYNKNMDLIDAAVKKNADDIAQLNSDTGFVRLNDSISYRVKNGYCTLTGGSNGSHALTAEQYVDMGTLPQNARPATEMFAHVNALGGAGIMFCKISENGKVQIWSSVTNSYWKFTAVFPVD